MSQPEPPPGKFVFLDLAGKRWPRAKRLVVLLGALGFLLAVAFVQSLLVAPQLVLPLKVKKLKEQLKSLQRQSVAPNAAVANAEAIKAFYRSANGKRRLEAITSQLTPRTARAPKPAGQIRLGFFVGWDPNCMDSLAAHADKLTHVCPEWFTLTSAAGDLAGENNVALLEFLAANKQLTLLPLLTNLAGDARNAEAVENLAHGPADVQARFAENLKQRLIDIKAGGVLIDWAGLDPAYQADFTRLLNAIAAGLHSAHLELWLQLPVGEERQAFDIDALSDPVDYFVAALHDQNSEEDAPGPIAAQNWFDGWLDAISSYGDPDQWVIALGAYGYDWAEATAATSSKTGYQRADTVSFADAMSRAAYAGEGNTESGPPEYNPSFDYTLAGVNHEVWFLDAVTFLNQARAARARGFTGFAIARLGTEEAQLWPALDLINSPKLTSADLAPLRELRTKSVITNIGEGEIVSVDISPADGHRQLSLDEPGQKLISTTYEKFPRYPSLYHQGSGGEHDVAITFDDGPDPTWTPKVLDVLREKGVKAAFFLVGQQAENYPDLVRKLVSEGHTIGSHTYTHTNLALCSEQRVKLELDATERLIESITGRSTTLFRPPYNADSRPSQLSEIVPLDIAQNLNYLTVLESIDPEDWARPGADVILQRIKQQRKSGNIILLHDAGGDRSQTVEALPKIIDYLRARGDQIVPLAQLIGADRDAVNPPVRAGVQGWARLASSVGFQTLHTVFGFLWAFMIVATGLIVLRTLIVVALALRRRSRLAAEAAPREPLSVIIAAYNEEKVLAATLRSVLETDYAGPVEVIVIDDGSKDETSSVALAIAESDRRVHVVTQANAGKSEALRRGVNISHHGILVFLDADTRFQPDTLRQLVAPFADERVGAVSGHAKVGNPRSFIARCQALEYICGFNLDRRAYDAWDCITVAPGAVSAIRASALREAGGFLPDTLAEDTDLTLTLHRRGYLIRYSAAAVAWTEAPETIGALAKQRFRWCFGTMQCLWKHRDMLFNPRFGALGFFSLPSVWFFQIILVALTPMVDLLLLASVLLGDGRAVLPYFLTFLLLDQVLAIMACMLEGEPVTRSWIMIPMRLIYRPLLSWVVWRSILNAARGVLVGWGKLERTASVMVPAGAGMKK